MAQPKRFTLTVQPAEFIDDIVIHDMFGGEHREISATSLDDLVQQVEAAGRGAGMDCVVKVRAAKGQRRFPGYSEMFEGGYGAGKAFGARSS